MFTGSVFLLPGQEIRDFTVKRAEIRETPRGREVKNTETSIGVIRAILAQAKPEEKERWKQLEHPITHKIIQQHTPEFDVKPNDVFEHSSRNGAVRRFYNQALPYNTGDINHWTIYYCEERTDIS